MRKIIIIWKWDEKFWEQQQDVVSTSFEKKIQNCVDCLVLGIKDKINGIKADDRLEKITKLLNSLINDKGDEIIFLIHKGNGLDVLANTRNLKAIKPFFFGGGGNDLIYYKNGGLIADSEFGDDVLERDGKIKKENFDFVWNSYYSKETIDKLLNLNFLLLDGQEFDPNANLKDEVDKKLYGNIREKTLKLFDDDSDENKNEFKNEIRLYITESD